MASTESATIAFWLKGVQVADVVVIDFETANERRGSPCALGFAEVSGLEIVGSGSFLIRPPEFRFEPFNVSLHGITSKMCASAPTWPEALAKLEAIVGDALVVAHYTPFDIGVIRDSCAYTGAVCPELHFACTRQIARVVWPDLASYCLPDVAVRAGVVLVAHHQAEADALAAAGIAIAATRLSGSSCVKELLDRIGVWPGTLLGGIYSRAILAAYSTRLPRVPSDGATFDPDHPFYGMRVTFTGGLMSMSRHIAQQAVVDVGGQPMTAVGKKTDFVVVGGEFHGLLAGHEHSHKLETALELRTQGVHLELLNEVEFLALLRGGA